MATKRKKKDPLGKLVLSSRGAGAFPLAVGLCFVALGALVSAVGVFVWIYLLAAGGLSLLIGAAGCWLYWADRGRGFELHTKGVRGFKDGEVTELTWGEVVKVVVVKSFRGSGGLMQITDLEDESREYRGAGVAYEFQVYGGDGEKVVVHCGGPNSAIDPRKLLRKLEEALPAGKVKVVEPNDENVDFG